MSRIHDPGFARSIPIPPSPGVLAPVGNVWKRRRPARRLRGAIRALVLRLVRIRTSASDSGAHDGGKQLAARGARPLLHSRRIIMCAAPCIHTRLDHELLKRTASRDGVHGDTGADQPDSPGVPDVGDVKRGRRFCTSSRIYVGVRSLAIATMRGAFPAIKKSLAGVSGFCFNTPFQGCLMELPRNISPLASALCPVLGPAPSRLARWRDPPLG